MTPLPYKDAKPVGAADFYFAINATFRFLLARFGPDGLRKYWGDLGARYFAPVASGWRTGGLAAVADYWRAFFAAEPGAIKTQDGLEYRVLKAGTGKAPQSGADMVTVRYKGMLINGKVFDDNHGKPATFPAGALVSRIGTLGKPVAFTAIAFGIGLLVIPFAVETRGQALPD